MKHLLSILFILTVFSTVGYSQFSSTSRLDTITNADTVYIYLGTFKENSVAECTANIESVSGTIAGTGVIELNHSLRGGENWIATADTLTFSDGLLDTFAANLTAAPRARAKYVTTGTQVTRVYTACAVKSVN